MAWLYSLRGRRRWAASREVCGLGLFQVTTEGLVGMEQFL